MADFKSPQPVKTKNPGDVDINISDPSTPAQKMGVDATGRACTKADIELAGVAIDANNPLPVSAVESNCKSVEYLETTSVAAAGTHTHTFSPSATEKLTGLIVGSSGCVKIEISYGVTASEVKKIEYFTTPAKPSESIMLPCAIPLAATDSVVVLVTNTDTDAFDISTTLFTE